MARVYLKGLPKLKAKLVKLRKDTMPDVMPAMAAAADKITDMMRRQVPVRTGKLRDSIAWTFGKAPKGVMKIATIKQGEATLTIYCGDRDKGVAHAWWTEFGTASHPQGGQFPGTTHPGSAAQPFFFTSYRALRKEAKKMIRQAISAAVKKAIR